MSLITLFDTFKLDYKDDHSSETVYELVTTRGKVHDHGKTIALAHNLHLPSFGRWILEMPLCSVCSSDEGNDGWRDRRALDEETGW